MGSELAWYLVYTALSAKLAFAGSTIVSAPLPGGAVRERCGIVIGVADGFDQRALAIGYDVRIVCRDGDCSCCPHSLPQREQ